MIVYLNGRFIPEENATISIHDRGFTYGDALFEAIRAYDGEPFLWQDHMDRFFVGCKTLRIESPLTTGELLAASKELLRRNALPNAIFRIILSRGIGARSYSPHGADYPTLAIAAFPVADLPSEYNAIISTVKLPSQDPFALFKHSNKLRQVLARAEADAAGVHEAFLLDSRGFVVEGTTTNVFRVKNGAVFTPPLGGILRGTTRGHLLRLCAHLGIPAGEKNFRPNELLTADGVFVTSCGVEVMEVTRIDGRRIKRSPLVRRLKKNYRTSIAAAH